MTKRGPYIKAQLPEARIRELKEKGMGVVKIAEVLTEELGPTISTSTIARVLSGIREIKPEPKRARSLYECANAKYMFEQGKIICAKGHPIELFGLNRLIRGAPLKITQCQDCPDFDDMGPWEGPRGWLDLLLKCPECGMELKIGVKDNLYWADCPCGFYVHAKDKEELKEKIKR